MATNVSGPLRLVTDVPATLVQVSVRAPRPRPHAGGMVVDFTTPATVRGGEVSFPCVPGPAVLSVTHAGVPQITVPLVVPDRANASLEECIRAAELADTATRSELEDLARRIVEGVASAEESAAAAQESAASAGTDAREVASAREIVDGYRAEVIDLHGEAVDARDTASAAAETATTQAETATDRAGAAAESAAAAGESEANVAVSAQTATQQADRSTSEADRAKSEADRAGQAAEDSSVKAVADKVNELLAGAPEAYDTLLEIAQELERGASAEAALTAAIAGKAPASHEHWARDVWDASGETVQQVLDSHELKVREIDGLKSGKLDKAEVSQDNTPGKVVRRQDDGHIISPNYSSGQQVLDTLKAQPKALASLWAAQQLAKDAIEAEVSATLTNGSIPRRTASGTINAADPQYQAEVATKGYVDTAMSKGGTLQKSTHTIPKGANPAFMVPSGWTSAIAVLNAVVDFSLGNEIETFSVKKNGFTNGQAVNEVQFCFPDAKYWFLNIRGELTFLRLT